MGYKPIWTVETIAQSWGKFWMKMGQIMNQIIFIFYPVGAKNEFIFCPNYLLLHMVAFLLSSFTSTYMQTALETTYMLLQ